MIDMPHLEAAGPGQVVLSLDAREQALKRRMIACFAAPRLRAQFYAAHECFRLLSAHELAPALRDRIPGEHARRRTVPVLEVELQASA